MAQPQEDFTFFPIDARHGLADSRVRGIEQLADKKLVFLTASGINVYNGKAFSTYIFNPKNTYHLKAYNAYRDMTCDSAGRIWIKRRESLYAFDSRQQQDVEDICHMFQSMGIKENVVNFFVPEKDMYVFITDSDGIYMVDGNSKPQKLGYIEKTRLPLLEHVVSRNNTLYLCYKGGLLDGIDKMSGKCTFHECGLPPGLTDSVQKGITYCMAGNYLLISNNHTAEARSILLAFDTKSKRWARKINVPFHITALAADAMNNILVGGKGLISISPDFKTERRIEYLPIKGNKGIRLADIEISCMKFDGYGGLWIGTLENGLFYTNTARASLFRTSSGTYSFGHQPTYCSENARKMIETAFPDITNCSYTDSRKLFYFGTLRGLMVFNASGKLIANIDDKNGLNDKNVQAIAEDKSGNIWITTLSGISCVTPKGYGTFEVRNYSEFDGISLKGKNFRPREIYCGRDGNIYAGFAGGTCSFSPQIVYNSKYAPVYTYKTKQEPYTWATVMAVMLFTIIFLWIWHRARAGKAKHATQHTEEQPDTRTGNKQFLLNINTQADEPDDTDIFLKKLREIVEENISNPNLSVVFLSQQLAMERSVLYRRMTTLTDMSPSTYIKEARFNSALQLLCNSNLSITEISNKVGFTDPKYFSKTFKDKFSVSPKEYRSLHAKDL